MRPLLPTFSLTLLAILSAACTDTIAARQAPDGEVAAMQAPLASVMGGIEAAIDAPWRLEPIGFDATTRSNLYPPIPLVVSIHDASMQSNAETAQHLGTFCGVTVVEQWQDGKVHYSPVDQTDLEPWQLVTRIPANSPLIREIERSDKWPYSSDRAANHRLCRRWAGEDCASVLDVGSAAEWHATIAYAPLQYQGSGDPFASASSPVRQGDDLRLTVNVQIANAGEACPPLNPSAGSRDRIFWGGMTNDLSIHLGEEALPRFDAGWVYGDLHYHGQGTDNEGESGYAYRPTLQAIRAIGLDFLFATEHASDSGQVTDLDGIFLNPDKTLIAPVLDSIIHSYVDTFKLGIKTSTNARRDMSLKRFSVLRDWLNRAGNGANADAVRAFEGSRLAPRIFLGGEVDVIPEMSAEERTAQVVRYGNGRKYPWAKACTEVPSEIRTLTEWTTAKVCETVFDLVEEAAERNRFLLKDIQGVADQYFARQHVIYLPMDGTRDDAFVSSHTTLLGGAHERLVEVLSPPKDNTIANTMVGKGYGFLAHPMEASSGSGLGRMGPDLVPYSDVQLRTAFEAREILGLQLWNEDTRVQNDTEAVPDSFGPLRKYQLVTRWQGVVPEVAYRDLHDGAFAWDKMLQWGLLPSQTAKLAWLAPGQPRRVFMAGGSDAHGDWNYRREGRLEGLSTITDTAIGKPRNLVHVGLERTDSVQASDGSTVKALGQKQVLDAIVRGDYSVTDGPALRVAIDTNNNGVIDDADTPMGGIGALTGATVPLLVEWRSSSEFMPVASIDLYVGVAGTSGDASLVYAPQNHGNHSAATAGGTRAAITYDEPSGKAHTVLRDGYMEDPSGLLHISPVASDYVGVGPGMSALGRRRILLPIAQFPVGKLRVDTFQGEDECKENFHCRKIGFNKECESVCTKPKPTYGYAFDGAAVATRIYIRAFARTHTQAPSGSCNAVLPVAEPRTMDLNVRCIERLAFSNPVWAIKPGATPVFIGGMTQTAFSP